MEDEDLSFLEDDFEVLDKLGKGGMGQVFKARQKSLDRLVAIKILPKDLCKNKEFVGRFKREARLAGKFYHPNAIQVYDIGDHKGQLYYIMEYVRGGSLKDKLNRDGRLDQMFVLQVIKEVLAVLKEAESMNIVHRDIKPDNIMLTLENVVKLADLGLAREIDDDSGLTQQKIAIGTPHYMAPEQAQGKAVDVRADQYALGVTAFHLLTGKPPYTGKNNMEILVQHVKADMPKPSSFWPNISPHLDKLVIKMTEKDPKKRFQTIDEALKAVEKVSKAMDGNPSKVVRRNDKMGGGSSVRTRASVVERRKEKNSSIGLIVLLVVLLVGVLSFVILNDDTNTEVSFNYDEKKTFIDKYMGDDKYQKALNEINLIISKCSGQQKMVLKKIKDVAETKLVKLKVEEIMIVSKESVEECEARVKKLHKLLKRYGGNSQAAKKAIATLNSTITSLKEEALVRNNKEKDQFRDEQLNKLSVTVSNLLEKHKYQKALDGIKIWREQYLDNTGKSDTLIETVHAVEKSYFEEVYKNSNRFLENEKFDEAIDQIKNYIKVSNTKKFRNKANSFISLVNSKQKKLLAGNRKKQDVLFNKCKYELFGLLKIGAVTAAEGKYKSYTSKVKFSKERDRFFITILKNYKFVLNRINDGLNGIYKEKLYLEKIGKKNIQGLIIKVEGGVIHYLYLKNNVTLESLNIGWATTLTDIAYRIVSAKNPERALQICSYAYVNGDFEGADRLLSSCSKKDKVFFNFLQPNVREDYLDWLDLHFDTIIDKVTNLAARKKKKLAKIILEKLRKRYSHTEIYIDRKEEVDDVFTELEE
ncbi:MAG: hypothetical protein COA79_13505 [Planctomycetota bacterium]|nr:MAG: hypothetical protein COA79_13505 [Planctomycetota bacterium]